MTIYVAYCKILLKENDYKIVELYVIELDVIWFVGSFWYLSVVWFKLDPDELVFCHCLNTKQRRLKIQH
jgi:hypothetical protein